MGCENASIEDFVLDEELDDNDRELVLRLMRILLNKLVNPQVQLQHPMVHGQS